MQLLRSRAKGSLQAIDNIIAIARLQRMQRQADDIQSVQTALFARLSNFRSDPRIDLFMQQCTPETYGKQLRLRCLGLLWSSQSGKSCKALSLYGPACGRDPVDCTFQQTRTHVYLLG